MSAGSVRRGIRGVIRHVTATEASPKPSRAKTAAIERHYFIRKIRFRFLPCLILVGFLLGYFSFVYQFLEECVTGLGHHLFSGLFKSFLQFCWVDSCAGVFLVDGRYF